VIRRLARVAAVLVAAVPLTLGVRQALANTSLPFQASYSGSSAFTSQSSVSFLGSGTASHMGRITNVGTVVLPFTMSLTGTVRLAHG
jgi:hypothetical protein